MEETGSNVFISFRFNDCHVIKDAISSVFKESPRINNLSENQNHSQYSDQTIRNYIYSKLQHTSITIALLTPNAINYKKDRYGNYSDWTYDEMRYSLEDRADNRTNEIIAVYTDEVKDRLFKIKTHKCAYCTGYKYKNLIQFNNLVSVNQCNVKQSYKRNPCVGLYGEADSYVQLVKLDEFLNKPQWYIHLAKERRRRQIDIIL